jgi:ribonucleoside-diphosphate reductase beta chain
MATVDEVIGRVESSPLRELGGLDIEDVYQHIDFLLRELPGPLDLYRRWERQQWSAHEVDFGVDRVHWAALDGFTRKNLEQIMAGFFVGEQAVTDTLSPILMGAPDEESRWFLSTQVVDEARHAYFFARFYTEVIGAAADLQGALAYARKWSRSDVYDQIFGRDGELVRTTEAVRQDPADTDAWVRAVVVYHVMVEGIAALTGQRLVLRLLRDLDLLPGFRAGFTAVTRDESRHVNYGVWALRRAASEGHRDAIVDQVERTLRPAMWLYANPERLIEIPPGVPPERLRDPRVNWAFAVESLTKRLRAVGIEPERVESLGERGTAAIWEAVEEYERRHGQDHPVRAWERGEPQAAQASA